MYRQSEKNLLRSNISSTCPHNMVNFSPLAAEIGPVVWAPNYRTWGWGTPANVSGFRVLAALLHSTPAVGVRQTAVLNRGHHLYSAGRPSCWASAQILVCRSFTVMCLKGTEADLGGGMGPVYGNPSTTIAIHISYHRISEVSCSFISVGLGRVSGRFHFLHIW